MCGRIVRPHVVDRLRKAIAHEMSPHTVYKHLIQITRLHHEFAKFISTYNIFDITTWINCLTIYKDWIGNLGDAISQLIINISLVRIFGESFTLERLVYQLHMRHISCAGLVATKCPSLTEESIHLPKLLLLPFIERVVVALCALHLKSQENSRCFCSGLSSFFLQFHRHEIYRPIEACRSRSV